jgi:hypothetical protein
VVGRVANVDIIFYSSAEWESSGPERVTCYGGADSMLRFLFKREGDGMKHYRNMKRRHRARLGSMGRKSNMVRWRDDAGQWRGGTREEKGRR